MEHKARDIKNIEYCIHKYTVREQIILGEIATLRNLVELSSSFGRSSYDLELCQRSAELAHCASVLQYLELILAKYEA